MMGRREFMALLGGAAAAWSLSARAQQPTMPVIVFLHPGVSEVGARDVAAFRKGLQETGYVRGLGGMDHSFSHCVMVRERPPRSDGAAREVFASSRLKTSAKPWMRPRRRSRALG